ncbi:NAD-dependent epimerase/dehydratase family protein [Candidatus Pelagibacter sp.]|nr:NAD-dependent epimerase/dehydratase family protein [Candidatus Pelagibacter sp.]
MNKSVIIFGGDGFCGWPTSLYLSKQGYDVVIVDNLSRRNIDKELGCKSLTPIQSIENRIKAWKDVTGKIIHFEHEDISQNYNAILELLKKFKPSAVVHFAEQRAAPYSMKGQFQKRYTINNNINATHNILCAIVDSGLDIHMIHLGSTGVYGYSSVGLEIPEGYLKVKVDVNGEDKQMEIPYPPHPGSVYHLTKTMDSLIFGYYNKNDNLRITDLHQGIVWGTETNETSIDERLINRFDYDGDYGTVLNRFVMQAAIGHPLTVHGTGGQTRAFIHIKDTVQCIRLAIENPPKKNERVKIFNQTTEQHSVHELAKKISKLSGAKIRYFVNPRKEDRDNSLKVSSKSFLNLGLNPTKLNEGLMNEIHKIASKYESNCDKSKIICSSVWRKDMIVDTIGSETPII